jgi:hypothetical protein
MCRNRKCQVCNNLIVSASIAVAGNNLVINIPTKVLQNRQKICLLLAQAIPAGGGTLPVVITDGATTIAVVRPDGNYVRADQLRTRTILNATIATTPPTAIVRNTCCLACTAFVQPQITGGVVSTARNEE